MPLDRTSSGKRANDNDRYKCAAGKIGLNPSKRFIWRPAPTSTTLFGARMITTSTSWTEGSVFFLFMLLWTTYGLLSQFNSIHGIQFDATAVVWSQEVLKIILSFGLYLIQDGTPRQLGHELKEYWTVICWYSIPAGLYALGDIITYMNLRVFDPATLHLLFEMKLVATAFVHQLIFHRRLNAWHMVALAIITLGCIIKGLDSMALSSVEDEPNGGIEYDADNSTASSSRQHPTAMNYALIAVHIIITTVAGVYNEKLLKDKLHLSINLQNMCLYLDGIIFLTLGVLAGLSENGSISEALSPSILQSIFSQPSVLAVACTMSVAGIVTSRFLKTFDSIRKSVAIALVVVSLPFLSRFFFGTMITANMIVSVSLVIGGMFMYISQPEPTAIHSAEGGGTTSGQQDDDDWYREEEAELILSAISLPDIKRQHIES